MSSSYGGENWQSDYKRCEYCNTLLCDGQIWTHKCYESTLRNTEKRQVYKNGDDACCLIL